MLYEMSLGIVFFYNSAMSLLSDASNKQILLPCSVIV